MILTNPPKFQNQILMLSSALTAPPTNFHKPLNWFRYELSKYSNNSLGVQFKSCRNTYRKPHASQFHFLKALDGWRFHDFYEFSGKDSKSTMEHINLFLDQMGQR